MNEKTRKVIQGYINLSDDERVMFRDIVQDYDRKVGYEKERVAKSIREGAGVVVGPVGQACPCCGR